MKKKLVDLSHTVKDGEITYKGLPAPIICDFISRKDSEVNYGVDTSFQIGKLEIISNTGTYIDCPFHRYEDGKDISEVALQKMVDIDGIVIDASNQMGRAIDRSVFEGYDLNSKAVLVRTDWSKHWQTDRYFEEHPYLTRDAAMYLRDVGVALVGIDSYNIDDITDEMRPVHTILLEEEILIVEHMNNLSALGNRNFTFTAVPPKIKGMGTFPVRAFAIIK